MSSYKVLCRICEKEFKMLQGESQDAGCLPCDVWFDGEAFAAFLRREIEGVFSEPLFKIATLPGGKKRPEPVYDLLNRLRDSIIIVETPEGEGPTD